MPPWATDVLNATMGMMEEEVPRSWLPIQTGTGYAELGCGSYGCVYQTKEPAVVLKLTSDDTEAEFAKYVAPTLRPEICVRHYLTIPLSYKSPRGFWLFLIWREAATHVGDVGLLGRRGEELVTEAGLVGDAAYGVANQMSDDLPIYLETWVMRCHEMRHVKSLRWLADGLVSNFHHNGVLFGDLHPSNIGRATRRGEQQWVITDMGRVAVVSSEHRRHAGSDLK